MMIFKKVSALAVRHICNPEPMGVIAESLAKKGIDAATATAEVDYLLSRVARYDRRANLQPQSSAAG